MRDSLKGSFLGIGIMALGGRPSPEREREGVATIPFSYSLIDCGGGRRLERFDQTLVSRPAPAAAFPPVLSPERWEAASLRFTREKGWEGETPPHWRVRFGSAVLALHPASQGQLGVFPEHAGVSDHIDAILSGRKPPAAGWRVLNLFAHTGLATLRLAALPGVGEVAHVDAAPAALRLARENAVDSGLADARIRWLADDALLFMNREIRRGKSYDIILADPPSYGRNRKSGGEWKLERDLPELLAAAEQLLSPEAVLFCLTCHSAGWDGDALAGAVGRALPRLRKVETTALRLKPESGGGSLPAGFAVLAAGTA